MKVLILGATGSLGKHIVTQAIERGHEVTALVRNPEKITDCTGSQSSPDRWMQLNLELAVTGQDAVIFALGTKPRSDHIFLRHHPPFVGSDAEVQCPTDSGRYRRRFRR